MNSTFNIEDPFYMGNKVSKVGGDYKYDGTIVGIVTKLSGETRYVVEDDRGVLFIFNAKQLKDRE